MALTRAQLLQGNSANGIVLPGTPQGVIQGPGITIDSAGVISVNASTVIGLVKLNNPAGYNAYVWPSVDGAAGTFLKTDGAGNLAWVTPQGFAVVTVSPIQPTPPDIGELWFDCNTGSLNVWQNCVGTPSPNWFNVGQPGLPALPANTTASPVFTGGNGTLATPYDCTVTTTGTSTTVFVTNTVTITNLAPFQFVPIVDLNAVINGGRFSFSNNYADAAGSLTFQTIFGDAPASAAGTSYTAAIKVGYGTVYIDAIVNLISVIPLTTTPGNITGTAATGATLTYTTGVASGGTSPYTYSWVWKYESTNTQVPGTAVDDPTIVVPVGAVGDRIYVELTATDSVAATATANTSNFPTPPATIQVAGITGAVAPTTIPGTANFTWADGPGNLTSTGCIEFSLDSGVTWLTASTPVVNGDTITSRWKDVAGSGLCGDAADAAVITGSLSDGTKTSNFTLTLDKVPNAFTFSPAVETTTPSTVTSTNPSFTVAGINSPAKIWGTFATTGSLPQYSVDGGTTWAAIPTAPGTATVDNGDTVRIRFTTGAAAATEVFTLDVGGSLTAKQSGTFTVTVSTAAFPNTAFSPAGAPNASPASVSASPLFGTASGTWADGSTSLTSTGGIQFSVNAGAYGVGPTAIADGNTIDVIWDPATITGAADGAVLTGTLTNGVNTNTYTITVSRAVTGLAFTDLTAQALSTAVQSAVVTPAGFNVPVTLTLAGTATDPLTSIGVSIAGGAFVTSPQTVQPGQTLQLEGTTGAANSIAYGVLATMGSGPAATDTWTATTTSVAASITTPSITAPVNGATDLNPALNSPSAITLTGSAYLPLNGAGAVQTSSLWEVYKGGYPLTSTNAITGVTQNAVSAWGPQTSGTTADLTGVSYGGGQFVAVGASGNIRTSPDGITWTARTSGTASYLYGVTYGGGQYVATGGVNLTSGTILTSPDGITWTSRSPGSTLLLYKTAYGGGQYVTVGQLGNTILTSPDGITWTIRTGGPNSRLFGVAYGAGLFVVGGQPFNQVYTSPDGITWTARTVSLPNQVDSITYAGGQFVAVGNTGGITTSPDGLTWTTRVSGTTTSFTDVTYGGGQYVAVGLSGLILTSPDGITWTPQTSGTTDYIAGVAYGADKYLTVGPSGSIRTATAATTTLTIAGCQTDGFPVGDTVISDPTAAGPATITAVDNTSVTVVPQSASWVVTQKLKRDPAPYTAVTGSPFTVSSSPFLSVAVPQAALVVSSTYYARVQYATTNASAATSLYSGWSSFATGSSFVPAIGTAFGGGYYAGQINDGGTVYNLIVAPVTSGSLNGQNGGSSPTTIQYKTAGSADAPSATVQNQVYGGLTTDLFKASAAHPVFSTFINGATGPNAGAFNLATGGAGGGTGIGGFNDWYLPAKNELEILYFNLKPSSLSNTTTSGINPNAVPPRASNYTTSAPARTTITLFQTGGGENFDVADSYWSSSEESSITSTAFVQFLANGSQGGTSKTNLKYARAVRRISA